MLPPDKLQQYFLKQPVVLAWPARKEENLSHSGPLKIESRFTEFPQEALPTFWGTNRLNVKINIRKHHYPPKHAQSSIRIII